jgi:hypothetical protein
MSTYVAPTAARAKKNVLALLTEHSAIVLHQSLEELDVLPRTAPNSVLSAKACQNVILDAPNTPVNN